MNKGTAIVGFLLCFLAGMGLQYGLDHGKKGGDVIVAAETGELDHSASPIPVTKEDPQWGNSDALVTIVEISDFECPFCGRVNPTLKRLKDEYGPKQVRVVWKHQPLPFHKNARPAHEAAATVHAIAGNDAFWKFHDLAFQNRANLTPENFEKWAVQAGADLAKFKADFAAKKYAAKVDKDMALAKSIGATGTPAFRINGVTLSGAQPYEKFKEIVDAQLAEAKKLVASGTPASQVYVALTKKNAGPAQPAAPEQAAKQPQQPPEDTTIWKVPVVDSDPQKGPKDALVTIVEWSEFQCPFCKRVLDTTKQIEQTYGKDVRIVWKDNPLPFHPRAKPTANFARFAQKAKGDAGFWQAHDLLFESQPKLEDDDMKGIAEKMGLNWTQAKAAIDGNKFAEPIDAAAELAAELNARGTPHFFVNGYRVTGAQPFDKFKTVIDAQLAKAKALVAKGTPRASVYAEIMKTAKGPPPPQRKEVGAAPKDAPAKGPATAKVTIHEFSDFECPFCSRVNPTMQQIVQEFGNKVRIVWRHMPLPFHQKAPLASEASQEIYAQKGHKAFWDYHDKLFANQKALERPNLEKYAEEIGGVDMAKFKAALDSRKHKPRVEADMEAAKKAGISGTPAFVINGYFLSGAQPYPSFKKLIDRALKEAK